MRPLMEGVFSSQAQLVAVIVVLGQIAIALSIASGWFIRQGLWAAVVLNVVFITCGRVNPSAFYLVMELALLFVLSEASRPSRRGPAAVVDDRHADGAGGRRLPRAVHRQRPSRRTGRRSGGDAGVHRPAHRSGRRHPLGPTGADRRGRPLLGGDGGLASGTEHRAPSQWCAPPCPTSPSTRSRIRPQGLRSPRSPRSAADVAEEPVARVAGSRRRFDRAGDGWRPSCGWPGRPDRPR